MSYCNENYLGFAVVAAAPIAAATGPLAPFVLAAAAIGSVLPMIHFGAGRKEADAIVPEQNKLGDALGQLDNILGNQVLSVDDLNQLDGQLRGMWDRFLSFIYQDSFTADGDTRASDQAKADLEWQVNGRLDRIAVMVSQLLGRPRIPAAVQSGVNQLQFRNTSNLNLPQSGFVAPGSTLPANNPQYIGPAPADNSLLLKLAVAGGLVLLLSRR